MGNVEKVDRSSGAHGLYGSRGALISVLVGALAATGCGSVTCKPITIVVAHKEEPTRLKSEVGGLRTTSTGSVVEERRESIVREYWVQAASGQEYRVSESDWRAAAVGSPLRVCPGSETMNVEKPAVPR